MNKTRLFFSALVAMVMMAVCPQHAWADKTTKAVLSDSTLTFYYDEADHSAEGTVYALNTADNNPDWYRKASTITAVVFDSSFKDARPTTCYSWFYNSDITTITGLSNLNTSAVTNMGYMFYYCTELTELDLSTFDTSSVTDMSYMFNSCTELTELDLSTFDTSNVTNMSHMFCGCLELQTLKLGSLNTSKVEDMSYMFSDCFELTALNLSSFNTENVKDMQHMFYNCAKLKTLDLSNFNTSNVTAFKDMFNECSALETLDISKFDTGAADDMQYMFYGCKSLTSLSLSSFNTANVTDMLSMFQHCESLTVLDLSSFNTSKVTKTAYMFSDCGNLATIYATENFSTSNVTNDNRMFYGCTALEGAIKFDENNIGKEYANLDGYFTDKTKRTAKAVLEDDGKTLTFYYDAKNHEGTVYALNTGANTPEWFSTNNTSTKAVVFDSSFKDARPTTCYCWFSNFKSLSSITGISNLNTSEVTNMEYMFYHCDALDSLDLSNFDTSNVTSMNSMFYYCESLTSLDLSNFDTSNVTSMNLMFIFCESLTSLNISKFNTEKVTSMTNMFCGCSSLKTLDLSSFNTKALNYVEGMFQDMTLTELDLSNFNTKNVRDMQCMFYDCSNLTTIYASDSFVISSVTSDGNMFYGCTSLEGAIKYDASKLGKAYANYTDGYFCNKNNPYAKAVLEDDGKTLTFYYDAKPYLSYTNYALNTYASSGTANPKWVQDSKNEKIECVKFDSSFKDYTPETCFRWFYQFKALTSITDICNLNTSAVKEMQSMFEECSAMTELDLSTFDTSNVTDMRYMFLDCDNLTTLDLSSFNTENVTDMSYMFAKCDSLQDVNISSFNIQNVTTMLSMFDGCKKLKAVDLSGDSFISTHLANMDYMFYNCNSLESVTFGSRFTAENVTSMNSAFAYCTSLKKLDLSTFNTSNVTNMYELFEECKALESITVNNFSMESVTNSSRMFENASSLKTLTLKSVPFLADGTFNSKTWKTLDYQLNDSSVIYFDSNHWPKTTSQKLYTNATYTRDVTSDWGTFIVPFTAVSNDDVQLYELSAVGSEALTFSPVETVAANTPSVFKKKNANATSVVITAADNMTISPATPITPDAVDNCLRICGTYEQLTNQLGIYFIAANKFWLAESHTTIPAFRAYFEGVLPATSAKVLNIIAEEADGSATTIGTLENGELRNGKFIENNRIVIYKNGQKYNVNGQIME